MEIKDIINNMIDELGRASEILSKVRNGEADEVDAAMDELYDDINNTLLYELESFDTKFAELNKLDKMIVSTINGDIVASKSNDSQYPGIDIEFVSNDDKGENASRPRVLMECPTTTNELRALIWADNNCEDYSDSIYFDVK